MTNTFNNTSIYESTARWLCRAFLYSSLPLLPLASLAQTAALPAGKSEYRYNQSIGNSSSVAVGITSSFGVSSSAQASPSYNAASSAALVLNTDRPENGALGAASPNHNSSIQVIGTEANNSPVNIKITSQSIQSKSSSGNASQDTIGSRQLTAADNFSDNDSSSSNAEFSAEGFGAIQDLRFRGGGDGSSTAGSKFTADVLPLLKTDEQGNTSSGTTYGTGSASSNAESRTRFQADITTSTFVNSFVSSF
jgi:hypothetical protein